MIGIVVALGDNESFGGLQEHVPAPLLPLADKPFLQHVVEYLASQNVTRLEFILRHLPEKIEHALGDGARWGCRFNFHLLGPNSDPLRLAASLASGVSGPVVLGHAEVLPDFQVAATPPGTLIYREDGQWTKWGVLSAADLAGGNLEALPRQQTAACLSVTSGPEFLRSQRLILDQAFSSILISGRQADPGIWIARNVALHPTATVTAPVYIGENCRIGPGARIGPYAAIGPNCIVDAQTIVVDSMVAAGTYVGEGLELDSVIVDRNRLFNVRLETSLLTSEAFLLGALTDKAGARTTARLFSILLALGLLLVFWPLLLLAWLVVLITGAGGVRSERMVHIPADDDPASWREASILTLAGGAGNSGPRAFFCRFLPGLLAVVRGDLFLVGVKPRSRAELLELPSDWKALYLRTKAGLITEASVMFGETPSDDELFTAEAYYSATESTAHDLRLLFLWFWQLIVRLPKTVENR